MIKKINQAASILGLVLCAVLAYVFWKAGLFDSKEALTSCISRFGWAGPAVFITFQAVQVVIPILPGGLGGVRSIRGCEPVLCAAREMAQAGKWVAAICAAPTVLAELGLLEGRRATCYPGMEPEMCGAVMQNAGVARDGNFITGRAAGSAFAFGLALVEALCGAETAARIAAQVVWNGEEAFHD